MSTDDNIFIVEQAKVSKQYRFLTALMTAVQLTVHIVTESKHLFLVV